MLYGEVNTVTIDGQQYSGIQVRVPNPPKVAVLGLPTNQQMIDRFWKQKSIRRSLGNGKSQSEFQPNLKADLELFNALRQDKGPEFDEYEASNAIGKLIYCEVKDCEAVNDQYRITLKTPFGDTVHTVGLPTLKDIALYRRSLVSATDLPHGQEELRFRIEPAAALYDSVVAGVTGYATGIIAKDVPVHHKSAVVADLVQAFDANTDLDPNS